MQNRKHLGATMVLVIVRLSIDLLNDIQGSVVTGLL